MYAILKLTTKKKLLFSITRLFVRLKIESCRFLVMHALQQLATTIPSPPNLDTSTYDYTGTCRTVGYGFRSIFIFWQKILNRVNFYSCY